MIEQPIDFLVSITICDFTGSCRYPITETGTINLAWGYIDKPIISDALDFSGIGNRAYEYYLTFLHEPDWCFDTHTAFAESFDVKV